MIMKNYASILLIRDLESVTFILLNLPCVDRKSKLGSWFADTMAAGAPFNNMIWLQSQHGKVITSIIKCGLGCTVEV